MLAFDEYCRTFAADNRRKNTIYWLKLEIYLKKSINDYRNCSLSNYLQQLCTHAYYLKVNLLCSLTYSSGEQQQLFIVTIYINSVIVRAQSAAASEPNNNVIRRMKTGTTGKLRPR